MSFLSSAWAERWLRVFKEPYETGRVWVIVGSWAEPFGCDWPDETPAANDNEVTVMAHDEQAIEKAIQDKGLTAPRVTPERVDSVIVSETYTVLPNGKVMVCELMLRNGFSVRGEASAVSKENFDIEIGRKVSRAKACDQIWQLEGYLLQECLSPVSRIP